MDRTAIETIQELVASTLGNLPTHIPSAVVPNSCKVQSLEHLQEHPSHTRAKFQTERLHDFCNYVKANVQPHDTAVFIKPDGSGASAILDYGTHETPLWGHHRAALKMKHTPEFSALLEASKRPLSQRDLIDWLEDWPDIITAEDMDLDKAIQRIRRIDIKTARAITTEEGNLSARRSAMEEIEATSGAESPPGTFLVRCCLYPHTQEREVTVMMLLSTGSEKPAFKLRIVGLEALQQQVAEEIELDIISRLEGMTTYVGNVEMQGA